MSRDRGYLKGDKAKALEQRLDLPDQYAQAVAPTYHSANVFSLGYWSRATGTSSTANVLTWRADIPLTATFMRFDVYYRATNAGDGGLVRARLWGSTAGGTGYKTLKTYSGSADDNWSMAASLTDHFNATEIMDRWGGLLEVQGLVKCTNPGDAGLKLIRPLILAVGLI